ncbi:unnamed protein product [Peniophora sp. CBMAI 1063]|nr:unnamed protein product [Peniophora sp. CBMAI 1063]
MSADSEDHHLDSLSRLTLENSSQESLFSSDRLGSASHINRLPVELLCRAFCWLPHFDAEEIGVTLNARTPPWVPVIHVCSSWRSAGMRCKELWSWIPLGHPEWTKVALRLSDPVPIAVRIPGEEIFFARFEEDVSPAHKLMKDAFDTMADHWSRVWHLDLRMARPESAYEEDGELHTAYIRARQMLSPLREARMDKLISVYCARVDLRLESLFDESWLAHVRHLKFTAAYIHDGLRFSHLPLVSLSINLALHYVSFSEWLLMFEHLDSLEILRIWDGLKQSRVNEIFGELPFRRVLFPRLKELSLMRSPPLMGLYLRCFDIPLTAQLDVSWWATDFDVPRTFIPELLVVSEWPAMDDWGDNANTLGHRLYRLSIHLCRTLLNHVHKVVTDAQHPTPFDPSAFTLPHTFESDQDNGGLTMNGLVWAPKSSTLVCMWARGNQPLYQDMFGVIGSMETYMEWIWLIDTMRSADDLADYARRHPVPAALSCRFEDDAYKRAGLATLTLVALQHVDFTNPLLQPYFMALSGLLLVKDQDLITVRYDIVILFPFGLKLTEAQRTYILQFRVRMSDHIEGYPYVEFEDTDAYA